MQQAAAILLPGSMYTSFYTESDCGGFYEPVYMLTTSGFEDVGDQISSIHISESLSAKVHRDQYLSGENMCITSDMWDLSQHSWPNGSPMNDSISSAEVFVNDSCIRQGSDNLSSTMTLTLVAV